MLELCTSPHVMMPGDKIPIDRTQNPTATLKVGPGLILLPSSPSSATPPPGQQQLLVTRLGLHGHAQSSSSHEQQHWIQGHSKRYTAALGDPVVGIIIAKNADGYRVDIGTSQPATLSGLAFEGATKRTKPNLKIGTVVYARISLALNHTEPEIECINPANQKADGYGEMTGGMLIRDLDLSYCKQLLSPPHKILNQIGAKYKFEVSIGMNGRVWCKAQSVSTTMAIINHIKNSS